jgi:HAD domain in Swiss Army Knife RNA repair proteins
MHPDQVLVPAKPLPWRLQGSRGPSEDSGPRTGAPDAVEVTRGDPLRVVYLGISGVLHPSASLYKFIHGCSPWSDGRSEYESTPVLAAALAGWPDARIVLTSTQPWPNGLMSVLERLGPRLASRVIGFTYEDLTSDGHLGAQQAALSSNGYWRLMKSEVVRLHRRRVRPSAWLAVDDEMACWTVDEHRDHVLLTDGCEGLLEPRAQDRLMTLLVGNFGAPRP